MLRVPLEFFLLLFDRLVEFTVGRSMLKIML